MLGRYYSNYDDDDDDYYDSYCYRVEESPKEEENLSINDLNEDEMEGNFRSLESCWFITINSPKKQYKLAIQTLLQEQKQKSSKRNNQIQAPDHYPPEETSKMLW